MQEKQHYSIIYDDIRERTDLNGNDKLIYTFIDHFCKMENCDFFFGSDSYIAKKNGMTERTVERIIKKLIKLKYIVKFKKKKGKKVKRFLTTNDIMKKDDKLTKEFVMKKIELIDYDWLNEEE